ncbi:hypothetical protein [Halobacteriovorax sp. JY17]|uniref:hypothetical protein n=1 Tax=Halobacteriovorax sp. JY17 TaxID=2014617 RepID=UPI000C503B65|nr:hypothetical protein [Halobacteriovorax sp. JY17]PIK15777.1 MAG: hypothetical protein CES88_03350 [Halobacteriovorax sp. JY17]
MTKKLLITFLFSISSYANFNVSYEVLSCNLVKDLCTVEVEFSEVKSGFLYVNTCENIDPNSESLQYCIEDLEVRASRAYNNR